MSSSIPPITPGAPWQPPSREALAPELPAYEIEGLLGRGGMGAVYKAKQKSLNRDVAIKVLPPTIDDSDMHFAERFKAEAQAMAKLNHPGIIAVYDAGETSGGLLYFVMEYVQGTDVQQMISSSGRLPQAHAHAIAANVCDALAYAHANGLIHRDIKPANIMVDRQGRVKVADFGLAKSVTENSGFTQSNMAVGTPDFVAPESLIAGMPVDGRADLYAVGVMLYQMLTGNVPRGAWHPPSVLLPGEVDPRFDQIVVKAMQQNRDARHSSAMEMRAHLDSLLMHAVAPPELQSYSSVGMAKNTAPAEVVRTVPVRSETTAPGTVRTTPPSAKSKAPVFIGGGAAAAAVIAFFALNGGENVKTTESREASGSAVATPQGGTAPLSQGNKPTSNQNASPAPVTSSTATSKPSAPAKAVSPLHQGSATALRNAPATATPEPNKDEPKPTTPVVRYTFPLPVPKRPTQAGQVIVWRLDGKPLSAEDSPLTSSTDVKDAVQVVAFNTSAKYHALLLRSDGTLRHLGDSNLAANQYPTGIKDVVKVFTAGSRGLALKDSGELIVWGGAQFSAEKVQLLRSSKVVDYVAVNSIDLALLESGQAVSLRNPATIDGAISKSGRCGAIAAAAGGSAACITDDGMLTWVGGDRAKIELGAGRHPFLQSPVGRVVVFDNLSGHSVAFTSDGTVAGVFGDNEFQTRIAGSKGLSDAVAFNDIHALRINGEWKFEASGVTVDVAFCESQSKGCFTLALTDKYAFGIKPADPSSLASQKMDVPMVAATSPAPSAPAPKSELDTRLETLAEQFKAAFAKAAGVAHAEAVGKLNQQFIGALQRQQAAAQASGKLDDLVTLKSEIERMNASPSIPEQDDDSTPALLKLMHDTYRKALAPLATDRDKKAEPVLKAYIQSLTTVQSDLTKVGQVDDALRVKSLIQNLSTTDAEDVNAAVGTKTPGKGDAAQLSIPPLSRKPGKLKAWGELLSKPVDLSKADKYSDFVQVAVKDSHWLALRANGETVSTETTFDGIKGVSAIKMEANYFRLITKKGATMIANGILETVESSTWGGGRLLDSSCTGGGLQVFIRDDGTVRLRDTQNRQGKPAIQPNKAREFTRSILNATQSTASGLCVFVRTATGRVHGWVGPRWNADKIANQEVVPLDLSVLPSDLQWISSTQGGGTATLTLLTKSGSIVEFQASETDFAFKPKTQTAGPPPGSVIAMVQQGMHPITRLKDGMWHLSGTSKLATQIRSMKAGIDIASVSGSIPDNNGGKLNTECVLWIE